MGRNRDLTQEEKGKIAALSLASWKVTDIARAINRSRCAVYNYLKNAQNHGTKRKNAGRKQKLSSRQKRLICKEASKGIYSVKEIRNVLKLDVCVETVRAVLHEDNRFQYCKPTLTPWLTEQHKKRRLEWAQKYVRYTDNQWRETIFSDEKKLNLDGPDGMSFYWHDLRKDKRIRLSRQAGGGSLMMWAAFSYYGRSKVAILSGKQKAEDYCETLEQYLHPMMNIHVQNNHSVLFQQDNAPIHTAHVTCDWLRFNFIRVMDWPARSPDLNPIENVWGALVRDVYRGGRQFYSVPELQSAVLTSWDKISVQLLQSLVSSMPKRCIELLQRSGAKTSY